MTQAVSFAPRPKNRITRPGDPFTFRTRLEAAWIGNQTLTINEVMRATGASRAVATTVRQRLVARGVLRPGRKCTTT